MAFVEGRQSTLRGPCGYACRRSAVGHDDQFPPPSLSDRCQLGEATFARMGGKEEHAPKADISYRAAAAHPVRILLRRDNPWTENN